MTQNLQFAPLESFVSPTFWHKLAEIKLDTGLDDTARQIFGFYTSQNAKSCLMELDYTAFNSTHQAPQHCHTALATIYNKNTIEAFKECDKRQLLFAEGQQMLEDFRSGRVLDDPKLLTRFAVLSFADIKCFSYYYWFCFPCPLTPLASCESTKGLADVPQLQPYVEVIQKMPTEEQQFFVLKLSDSTKALSLKEALGSEEEITQISLKPEDYFFCFADASAYEQPSWHMRTYLALILYKCPQLIGKCINFLGLRSGGKLQDLSKSIVWQIVQQESVDFENEAEVKFVGWELNEKGKPTPRMVCMKDSMDSKKLAEDSVNLNLKLMKWRLVPSLNLDVLASTKCLLFGSGTLGCAVARNLLAWGFKHITLADNGKVGYSNPVRQSLFTHADAMTGNSMKAPTAAKHLKEINPNAITEGHVLKIPMPGHTIDQSMVPETVADLNKISELVATHDAIFLLMDSRESRWLPTLLGAAQKKIVINAALGFDSYLVMRHGIHKTPSEAAEEGAQAQGDIGDLRCIRGANLGCYFCNDVTAPGNSMKDRTLDQQCTVTRPGVSNIAGSYAVELLVALLQHPEGIEAPAYFAATGKCDEVKMPEGILGVLPHSIRGVLSTFENVLPATEKFQQCIACSEKVMQEYEQHGNNFILRVIESNKYLEDLTGISDYNKLDSVMIDFDEMEMADDDDE